MKRNRSRYVREVVCRRSAGPCFLGLYATAKLCVTCNEFQLHLVMKIDIETCRTSLVFLWYLSHKRILHVRQIELYCRPVHFIKSNTTYRQSDNARNTHNSLIKV